MMTRPSNPLTVERVGTDAGSISGFGEVIARVRNTAAGRHTAFSVDAVKGRDAIPYLAENGSAEWDVRSDASSGAFQVHHQGGRANTTGVVIAASGTVGIGQPDARVMAGGFWLPIPLGVCEDDGDVDLFDHDRFTGCLTVPDGVVTPECRCFDIDRNGTVDLGDFSFVQVGFTG